MRQTGDQNDEITLRSWIRCRVGGGLAPGCHPSPHWPSMLVSAILPLSRFQKTNTTFRTRTRSQLGIGATITNYPEFVSSMDQHWSTSGVSFSGTERVIVYTSLETFDGGSFTGYYTYDINALRSAGYTITTSTQLSVSCAPTATSSAVGECEPHGDHWHCPPGVSEPITPPSPEPHTTHSAPSSGECEAHNDHWHCPPGVTEPTTPPAPSSTPVPITPGSDECEAHGDHLHCPDGVPEPTTPPPVITPTPTPFSSVTASASFTRTASDAPVVTAGADGKTRVGSHFLVLAAGVPFVFGMM
ncbi:hypothetical protein QC761_206700 [Podospora bellae-mahoneyi]|uniref:Uncharacterized protein n=1 Tax=Podospora bellae-mahoneyi TaxID=2093777 RepID=A0ABR0FPW6_9PEZI|nr:hypothetical protein QC761_206700 [Podospora bellae-mahoneyi]